MSKKYEGLKMEVMVLTAYNTGVSLDQLLLLDKLYSESRSGSVPEDAKALANPSGRPSRRLK